MKQRFHDKEAQERDKKRTIRETREIARETERAIASGEIEKPWEDVRLDKYLADQNPATSRSIFQKLIINNRVEVNGKHITNPKYKVKQIDKVNFFMPHVLTFADEIKDFAKNVIFENKNSVVIAKPAGILTHSKGELNDEFTVADFAKSRIIADKSEDQDQDEFAKGNRPGIVHRLDRATSGVLIIAKDPSSAHMFQKQFSERKAHKTYFAITDHAPKVDHAKIDLPIGRNPKAPSTFRVDANGKSAQTEYRVLDKFSDGGVLIELKPATGRTHQLRVHLSYIGAPITGDPIYNASFAKKYAKKTIDEKISSRMFLHAQNLEITIPKDGENVRETFHAPIPDDFRAEILSRDPDFDFAKIGE